MISFVHARGTGLFGEFVPTADISSLTSAKVFTPDTKTPVFVRFSTVMGYRGSPEAARDPRGTLTISNGDAAAAIGVDLPGAQCTLTTRDKLELTCSTGRNFRSNLETDFVSRPFNCGATPEALLTGDSDWTQADSLRVVAMHDHAEQVAEPMAFSGPILALWTGVESETARVIWRDLATGDYEAGIVTASCGP